MALLNTYRNTRFVRRDYECTNIVACRAEEAPGEQWAPCAESELAKLTQLWTERGVTYFGYL